ncbi:MAG: hypothetical protein BM555_02755 [Crocinitomix sp. MedPE-SWsnd]|mgnify:CR=1 FL=1|nr:MAG: hypothetical protein BM555_02755 [Crocinitomix sp. MedPE-SWsnd]
MKKITLGLFGLGILCLFNSCHKEENYYCYLVDTENYWVTDTLDCWGEGLIYKKGRPEDKCYERLYEIDSLKEAGDPWYTGSYSCWCDWEPE